MLNFTSSELVATLTGSFVGSVVKLNYLAEQSVAPSSDPYFLFIKFRRARFNLHANLLYFELITIK